MMSGVISLENKRVLVVGGNGFVGRHVVRHFDSMGCDVLILDIAAPPEEFSHLTSFVGDVSDVSLFASAVQSVDTVVFLANSSLPGSANIDLAQEVISHVAYTVKAAEISAAQSVRRFLFASSGGTVYGYGAEDPLPETALTTPKNAYGVSKLSIEHYLRLVSMNTGMDTVCLRISNPFGEGQRAVRNQGFVAVALEHGLHGRSLPLWGDGSVERDFIYISDVAAAFCAAAQAKAPPSVVNIGSGVPRSLREVLNESETALGRAIDVKYEPGRTIDVSRNVLDINLAQKTLGWSPQVSFEDGVARTAKWWLSLA